MKKIFSLLSVAALSLLISCSNKKESGGGMSDAAKKNLDAMHGVTKCFDTKDFSKLGDYIAEDAVDHAGEMGDVKGLAAIKASFEKMSAGYDAQTTEVITELANDEWAMSWLRFKGTMKMDQGGMKAGDKYDMQAIEVAKFNKDGKATEHWTFMQPAEMMKMMQSMPSDMKPADTTKGKPTDPGN